MIASCAESLKHFPAVDLESSIHEIGALTQLVAPEESAQVVGSPSIEARLFRKSLGRSARDVAQQGGEAQLPQKRDLQIHS